MIYQRKKANIILHLGSNRRFWRTRIPGEPQKKNMNKSQTFLEKKISANLLLYAGQHLSGKWFP